MRTVRCMIEFIGYLEVDDPPSVAFELLADMSVLEKWNPNVSTSERIHGSRLAVGSRYRSTIKRGPMRMTALSELVSIDPGRMVEYEGAIFRFWSVDSLTFEPVGDHTRITFRNKTTSPVWLRPFEPIVNRAFQHQARRAVEGAEQYLTDQRSP